MKCGLVFLGDGLVMSDHHKRRLYKEKKVNHALFCPMTQG